MIKSFLIVAFSIFLLSGIDISELRKKYPEANESSEITNKLNTFLSEVSLADEPILMAYKGAVLTLKAKHAKGIKDKKNFFKEGVSFLETAIEKDPTNIEMRLLRLSVQENAPKITGYRANLKEDKQFLHKNYGHTKSPEIKNFIKGYINTSRLFTDAEKQLF